MTMMEIVVWGVVIFVILVVIGLVLNVLLCDKTIGDSYTRTKSGG